MSGDKERGYLTPDEYDDEMRDRDDYSVLPVPDLVDPAKATKFDERMRGVFLRAYAHTGVQETAAAIAGVTSQTVTGHKKADPEFARACADAYANYTGRLERELNHQALEGVWEPIIGKTSRDTDDVIGYKRVKKFEALRMLVQRHIPAYRHNGDGAPGGSGRPGVLLVYPIRTEVDWERATEGKLLPIDPLHGIPGAEGLLLEDQTSRRGRVPDDQE